VTKDSKGREPRDGDIVGTPPKCSQCDTPAYYAMGQPLCVDHAMKVRQFEESITRQRMAMVNYLKDSAETTIFGAPITTARYDLPVPVLHNGPVTLNNFSFDGSTLGVLNLGQVHSIDVTISEIQSAEPGVARALSDLTKAVAEAKEVTQEQRAETMEAVAFLAEEMRKPPEERKASFIKKAAASIGTVAAVVEAVRKVWDVAGPVILKFFGL
jgi:hypothetical protein